LISLTNRQARQFILLKHGLVGEYKFSGKQGALDYIHQVGCLQFDPVDMCGKNAELSLQSRVKDFTKDTLDELLYKDRLLVDYPDKNLSIILTEDWPFYERYRRVSRSNAKKYPEIKALAKQVRAHIKANGPICSSDIKLEGNFFWHSAIHWSAGSNLSRSVLEQMYSTGDLIIHHKNGTRKYYDLAERYIAPDILNAPEPLPREFDHIIWRILRRIGAVGLLWDRPSDAFLNIWDLSNKIREQVFRTLCEEGKIVAVNVENLRQSSYYTLHCRTDDMPLIETVIQNPKLQPRCELIAPLDPFLWDRKLIRALFNYEYAWEIYTPPQKRKYGVYVLPLLLGESFAGRVEAVNDRKTKTLIIKNIWYEEDVKQTKKMQTMVDGCLKRFAKFNKCEQVKREKGKVKSEE
jgi:uncharacterized protein YcaQ